MYSIKVDKDIILGIQFIVTTSGSNNEIEDWQNLENAYNLSLDNKEEYEELIFSGLNPWEVTKIKLCPICKGNIKINVTVCEHCGNNV